MFDIGFAELLLIAVVGLLVLGPERLPEAIRTGAAWLNRLRRGFNDIKREIQQELHNDAIMRELRDSGRELTQESAPTGGAPAASAADTAPAPPADGGDAAAGTPERASPGTASADTPQPRPAPSGDGPRPPERDAG